MFILESGVINDPYESFRHNDSLVRIDKIVQSIPLFDKENGYLYFDLDKENRLKKKFTDLGLNYGNIPEYAIETNNLDLFKKAEEKGLTRIISDLRMDFDELCDLAIEKNNFDFLVYLVENKYNMNASTFSIAVAKNNLKMMDYLYKAKCPWDEEATQVAMENDFNEALRFLLDRKCPISVEDIVEDIDEYSDRIKEILKEYKLIMSDEMDAKTIVLRWMRENYEPLSDYYGETFAEADVKPGDTLEEARAKLLRSFEQTNYGFLIREELDEIETENATDNDRLAKKALVDLTDGQLDEIMREFEIGRLKNDIWDDHIRFAITKTKEDVLAMMDGES